MRRSPFLALALGLFVSATAHAGPVERFNAIQVDPKLPASVVLQYMWGGGGLFISSDGAKSFGLLCNSAIDKTVQRDVSAVHQNGAGAIFIGVFDGMWQGNKDGCGWKQVADLKDKWVSAIAGDPVDPNITYAVTSNGGAANGMWMNDGKSDKWTPLGTPIERFRDTLNVVKTASGKRFYETTVTSIQKMDAAGMPVDEIHYLIRYSDDNAMNWTEAEFDGAPLLNSTDAVHIRAIDPTDPNRIVVIVATSKEKTADQLYFSPMQGKAGTWTKIGEGTTIEGVAFTGDGKLVYGDNDQDTRGLFIVDKLGMQPKRINDSWRPGCLNWDATNNRMYACNEWTFGSVDLTTGTLTTLLDMRTAERFVECPGEPSLVDRCQPQLLAAYCGVTHFPDAGLCKPYAAALGLDGGMSGGTAGSSASSGSGGASGSGASATAAGGSASLPRAGAPAASSGSSTGTTASAGASTPAAGSGAPGPKSGCSFSAASAASDVSSGVIAGLFALNWLGVRRRRSPRA